MARYIETTQLLWYGSADPETLDVVIPHSLVMNAPAGIYAVRADEVRAELQQYANSRFAELRGILKKARLAGVGMLFVTDDREAESE